MVARTRPGRAEARSLRRDMPPHVRLYSISISRTRFCMRTASTALRMVSPSLSFAGIGSVELHIFQAAKARGKGLTRFQVLHPIKLERVGHSAENAFGNFKAFAGQLVNFCLRLQIARESERGWKDEKDENEPGCGMELCRARLRRDKADDENGERDQEADNECGRVFPLR